MSTRKIVAVLLAALTAPAMSYGAPDFNSAFEAGEVSGNIRSYYNTRHYSTREDEGAFALGGALRAQTAALGWAKLGVGFYTAQDLGSNDSDPAKVNGRLGSDLEVLGEAYIAAATFDTTMTLGRQKLDTPFANAGDAFIIPFTFEATSVRSTKVANFSFDLAYITAIKNRNSDEFVDVGKWSTNRYGLGPASTSGTLVVGATYKASGMDIQLWHYEFADLFDMNYLQAGYTFAVSETFKPFAAVQYGIQSDSGDELLGIVDSSIYGVQGGASFGKAKLTLAYNSVSEEEGAFGNGAFLAPYNFSTSPLFTNNMLQTMENVDAGEAAKLTFDYKFPSVSLRLSYAELDFETATDREAVGADITYALEQYLPGLSLRWRVEKVSADVEAAEVTNHRLQLQYVF